METIIFIDNIELIKKLRQDLIDNGFVDGENDEFCENAYSINESESYITAAKHEGRNVWMAYMHIEDDMTFCLYNHDMSLSAESEILRLTATESNYNEVLTTIIERYKTA